MGEALSDGRGRTRASVARRLALQALGRIEGRGAFAQDVIAKVVDASDAPEADRAFATRLVLGVVSVRGTLDAVLDRCLRSPTDVKPDVRRALRIPVYEMVYLGKSPHAAVDQGVELVRSVAPKAAGLANAVLRKVAKEARAFPFGDPARDLAALSLLEGFPPWLTGLLESEWGRPAMEAFERASNEPAPVFLFENTLVAQPGRVVEAASAAGGASKVATLEGVPLHGCLLLKDRRGLVSPSLARLLDEGRALVSDASAQAVASLCALLATSAHEGPLDDVARLAEAPALGARHAPSVLELCAGRGTKTVMIQANVQRACGVQAPVYVALDNVPFKCELLGKRAKRCGAHVSETVCAELGGDGLIAEGEFDLVFLDAPCSGLGTLRRHPEIRWRIEPGVVEAAAELDVRLLRQAARSVRVGGFLVYATCTVTHAENGQAVGSFLESPDGAAFGTVSVFGGRSFRPALVPGGPDAHFCAVMQRLR